MPTTRPAHPYTIPIPTGQVSTWYIGAIGLAQFGIFIGILSPIYVSMQLKAQQLVPEDPASVIALVMPLGAFGALIGNPLFGALSDRTRTRWGRRRPWLVGGVLTLALGLVTVAYSPTLPTLAVSWIVCQLGTNAAFAALVASFADNVPEVQRGKASGMFGIGQNIAVLAGTYAAALLVENLPVLFILPGVIGAVCVFAYAIITPDRLPETRPKPFTLATFLGTFWTNPIKHPDFAMVWWSRFAITLAMFLFTTFRLFYMQDQLGLETADATVAVATGVLFYTLALLASATLSGWLSDKLRRRKPFIAGSTLLFGVGTVMLAYSTEIGHFYVAEIVMGFAYGIYAAIENAFTVEVLPDREKPGKDLGVNNIASALPQSLAPAIGAMLLGIGGGTGNYTALLWGAGIVALAGAIVVMPVKSAR